METTKVLEEIIKEGELVVVILKQEVSKKHYTFISFHFISYL
jgi:hypothetical protein